MLKPWMDDRLAVNGRAVRENFQAWFGVSHVIDVDKFPLVVYHGTKGDFSFFDKKEAMRERSSGMEDTALGHFFSSKSFVADHSSGYRSGSYAPTGANVMPVYLSINNPATFDYDELLGLTKRSAGVLRKRFESMGCDGVIIDDPGGGVIYIAFNPTQIKSAIGNSGLYQKNNPSVIDDDTRSALLLAQRARRVAGQMTKSSNQKALCLPAPR